MTDTNSNTSLIVLIFSLISIILLLICAFVTYHLYMTRRIMVDIPFIPSNVPIIEIPERRRKHHSIL